MGTPQIITNQKPLLKPSSRKKQLHKIWITLKTKKVQLHLSKNKEEQPQGVWDFPDLKPRFENSHLISMAIPNTTSLLHQTDSKTTKITTTPKKEPSAPDSPESTWLFLALPIYWCFKSSFTVWCMIPTVRKVVVNILISSTTNCSHKKWRSEPYSPIRRHMKQICWQEGIWNTYMHADIFYFSLRTWTSLTSHRSPMGALQIIRWSLRTSSCMCFQTQKKLGAQKDEELDAGNFYYKTPDNEYN